MGYSLFFLKYPVPLLWGSVLKRDSSFLHMSLCRVVPVLFFLLLSLGILSCDMWNKDMLGFLEYWSDTLQMGEVKVTGATIQKDASGMDTVSLAATPHYYRLYH